MVICDDQELVRDGLALLLGLDPDIEVVGLAADGAAAVRLVADTVPDLVLMDLMMPGVNGVEATRRIRSAYPATQVLVLTTYDADEWVFDAIRAGATGYLLKDMPREEMLRAVKGTTAGKSYLDPTVAGKIVNQLAQARPTVLPALPTPLSEREVVVLRLVAQGRTNIEIAEQLHLSEGTVRNHVSTILDKLNVGDRTQAAVLAIQHGLGG